MKKSHIEPRGNYWWKLMQLEQDAQSQKYRWKINCVRNRVKGSKRITPDCRSNLFTQDLSDVKCNITVKVNTSTLEHHISCHDYCPNWGT